MGHQQKILVDVAFLRWSVLSERLDVLENMRRVLDHVQWDFLFASHLEWWRSADSNSARSGIVQSRGTESDTFGMDMLFV